MTTRIEFFVPGEPKSQPRPRAFARKFGDKWQARVYDAGTAEGWKSSIAVAAHAHTPAAPLPGPLAFSVEFRLPRPTGHYGTGRNARTLKAGSPWRPDGDKRDWDNLAKAVCDSLTVLGFWGDDRQIVDGRSAKWYAADPSEVGALIVVETLEQVAAPKPAASSAIAGAKVDA